MPLRLTEKQYEELLQQQKQSQGKEYWNGRPRETVERGHGGPGPEPESAEPEATPDINTDIGGWFRKNDRVVKGVVISFIPGVKPLAALLALCAVFLVAAPFGSVLGNLNFIIERSTAWYDLMIRAGLSIGPGVCLAIFVVSSLCLYAGYHLFHR